MSGSRRSIRNRRLVCAGVALLAIIPTTRGTGAQSTQVASAAQETAACQKDSRRLQAGLAAAYADFQRASVPKTIATLVAVDGRIRGLLDHRPSYRPCNEDEQIFDKRWTEMGVDIGWGERLEYSGKLLVEAHSRNPRSALRPYTLFSTVFGVVEVPGLGVMPHIDKAFAYAAEFPHGPFVREVYQTIAGFHKDLYMVLRDKRTDYKFDCYKPYIKVGPWGPQQDRAKGVALDYYQRVLVLAPRDEMARQFSDELRRGVVRGWSFCAD